MIQAGFMVDLDRCVGCGACILACRIENEWPDGVVWRRVLPLNLDRHPGGPTYHLSVSCHHCERPACLRACPSGAYVKSPNGVVTLDGDRCLGCLYCEMACPFGAPSFDEAAGVMTKCDLCDDRINRDGSPACVDACPTGALLLFPGNSRDKEEKNNSAAGVDGVGDIEDAIPGFTDSTGCLPAICFKRPGGGVRIARMERLMKVLER